MGHWNHRVIRYKDAAAEGGYYYSVCEVYYGENGIPMSWSEHADVGGDSLDEIKSALVMILGCLKYPIMEIRGKKLVEIKRRRNAKTPIR